MIGRADHVETVRDQTRRIGRALGVVGLMNIQFAIKNETSCTCWR